MCDTMKFRVYFQKSISHQNDIQKPQTVPLEVHQDERTTIPHGIKFIFYFYVGWMRDTLIYNNSIPHKLFRNIFWLLAYKIARIRSFFGVGP